MTPASSHSTDEVHTGRATQDELPAAAQSSLAFTLNKRKKGNQESLDITTQPSTINPWSWLVRANEFSPNWRDEMRPVVSKTITTLLTGIPSTSRAAQRGVPEAETLSSQPPTEESNFPMLRLPRGYIWSGEKEQYQRHVHYAPYERFDGREIIDDKSKTSKLGDGGFGSVRRVLCNSRLLARKEMRPRQGDDYDIKREVKILENLVHRHIVELAGTYTQDGTLYILLYPVAECNLAQKLQAFRLHDWGSHFEPDLLPAFGCLASALAFIHSKEIAIKHKDIKPSNILFYHGSVLLADWGLSNCFKDKENSRSSGRTYCTPSYAAPEVVGREERGTAQDVFSLGLVYAEMMAALCQVTIFDQEAIGDSRWRAFSGVDMDPRPYNVLAQGPIRGNSRQLDFLEGHGLFKHPSQYRNAESRCTLFHESSLTELFTTMLAKSPADRPSAHQVLQSLKAPASIGKPCGGCLVDDAHGETSVKATLPLVIYDPTANAECDWSLPFDVWYPEDMGSQFSTSYSREMGSGNESIPDFRIQF